MSEKTSRKRARKTTQTEPEILALNQLIKELQSSKTEYEKFAKTNIKLIKEQNEYYRELIGKAYEVTKKSIDVDVEPVKDVLSDLNKTIDRLVEEKQQTVVEVKKTSNSTEKYILYLCVFFTLFSMLMTSLRTNKIAKFNQLKKEYKQYRADTELYEELKIYYLETSQYGKTAQTFKNKNYPVARKLEKGIK